MSLETSHTMQPRNNIKELVARLQAFIGRNNHVEAYLVSKRDLLPIDGRWNIIEYSRTLTCIILDISQTSYLIIKAPCSYIRESKQADKKTLIINVGDDKIIDITLEPRVAVKCYRKVLSIEPRARHTRQHIVQ